MKIKWSKPLDIPAADEWYEYEDNPRVLLWSFLMGVWIMGVCAAVAGLWWWL